MRELENLEIGKNLRILHKCEIDFIDKTKKIEELQKKFSKIKKPTDKSEFQKDTLILELEKNIKELCISEKLGKFISKLKSNELSVNILELLEEEIAIALNKSKTNLLENLIEYNGIEIANFENFLISLKGHYLKDIFNVYINKKNSQEYNFSKDLITLFNEYNVEGQESMLTNDVFNKGLTEVISDLENYQSKFDSIEKWTSLKIALEFQIDEIINHTKTAKNFATRLVDERVKKRSTPNLDNSYELCKNNLEKEINLKGNLESELIKLKNILERYNIPRTKLDNLIKIGDYQKNYNLKNMKYSGNEDKTMIALKAEKEKYESEIKSVEFALVNEKYKLESEDKKENPPYSKYKNEINMFSKKLSHFLRWLQQNNKIIKESGELDISLADNNAPYLRLIGEFVASVLDRKILYQDKEERIAYIDYTKKIPKYYTYMGRGLVCAIAKSNNT